MDITAPHRHPTSFPFPEPRSRTLRRRVSAGVAAGLATLGIGVFAGVRSTGAASSAPSSAATVPLSARVLAPSALPGFMLAADSAPVHSAYDWARAERSRTPSRETARLRALGFVGAFDELLHARYPHTATGVSVVERYRTPSGAGRELAYQYTRLAHQPAPRVSTFPVSSIPGARGIRILDHGTIDEKVLFSYRSEFYMIGTVSPSGSHGVPTARLSNAATTLYLTNAGCVANAK